jgi:hypothetical protein
MEPVGGAARFLTAVKSKAELQPLVLFSGDIFAPSISKCGMRDNLDFKKSVKNKTLGFKFLLIFQIFPYTAAGSLLLSTKTPNFFSYFNLTGLGKLEPQLVKIIYICYCILENCLKGQSHEKVGELRVWRGSLGPN